MRILLERPVDTGTWQERRRLVLSRILGIKRCHAPRFRKDGSQLVSRTALAFISGGLASKGKRTWSAAL